MRTRITVWLVRNLKSMTDLDLCRYRNFNIELNADGLAGMGGDSIFAFANQTNFSISNSEG
ncbi:MAG: hypothetical protein NZ805_15540 [Armatimonadetes bacterium]|nr:hypothetical protein [Armatimonadota bacterium]MDW8029889.1 hypothetical protein [Armatimonadota bacterium]